VHHAAMHTTDTPHPRSITNQLGDDRLVLSVAEAGALLGLSAPSPTSLSPGGSCPWSAPGATLWSPKPLSSSCSTLPLRSDKSSTPMLSIGKEVAGAVVVNPDELLRVCAPRWQTSPIAQEAHPSLGVYAPDTDSAVPADLVVGISVPSVGPGSGGQGVA
jgi:hypothetical protein